MKQKKWYITLLMVMCMYLAAPPSLWAQAQILNLRLLVNSNTNQSGTGWSWNNADSLLTILNGADVLITSQPTPTAPPDTLRGSNPYGKFPRIYVANNATANITLSGLVIEGDTLIGAGSASGCPLYIDAGADVTLKLDTLTENYLRAYGPNAAVHVAPTSTLTITGGGKLRAHNYWSAIGVNNICTISSGAGIGGYHSNVNNSTGADCGNIIIRGYAQVDAQGGQGSAGIGGASGQGGSYGPCGGRWYTYTGNITIKESANVLTHGGSTACGIGAGMGCTNNGVVNIEGGYVTSWGHSGRDVWSTTGFGPAGANGIGNSAGSGGGLVNITGGFIDSHAGGRGGMGGNMAGIGGTTVTIDGNAIVNISRHWTYGPDVQNPDIKNGIVLGDAMGRVYGKVTIDRSYNLSGLNYRIFVPTGTSLTVPDSAMQWTGNYEYICFNIGNGYISPQSSGTDLNGGVVSIEMPRHCGVSGKVNGACVDLQFDLKERTTNSLTFGPATRLAITKDSTTISNPRYRIQDIEYCVSTRNNNPNAADLANHLVVDSTATGLTEIRFPNLNDRTQYYLYARTRENDNFKAGPWAKVGPTHTLLLPKSSDFIINPKSVVYNGATQYPVITANTASIPSFIPLSVDDISAPRYNGSTGIPQIVNPYKVSVDIPAKADYFVAATDLLLDTYNITPATLTVIPVSGQGKYYGDEDPVLAYTVTGFVGGENQSVLTGALSRASGDAQGTYNITIGTLAAPNYTIDLKNAIFEIKAKTISDQDLIAGVAVANPVACAGSAFSAITFSAKDRGTAVTGVTYRVELVSGDPIVSIPAASTATSWTPAAAMAGKAVYRVVPVYQNREGVAATFALEARKSLTEIVSGLQFAAVTYLNGDRVQAVNLDELVPEGVKVTWANNNANIGLATSGAGFVPEFTATNTGTANITATITYTLAYEDGKGCTNSATATQSVTVKPKTSLDQDLVAGVTASNPLTCSGTKFAAITFSAKDKGTAVTSGVTFRVEFVGGDPVIAGFPVTLTTATWEPTPTLAGKAVFRVVPIYQNREGAAATFALEARKPLAEIAAGLNFAAVNYQNGDQVQAVNLNALVPEGVKISWANNNANIGLAASGAGFIPEFTAINTGATNTSATITYTLAYGDGKGCTVSATTTQTITVKPKTSLDQDLVAGVSVPTPVTCSNVAFAALTFSAKDRGTNLTAGVTYRVELVSGDPVVANIPATLTATAWNPGTPTMAGKAIYRVVPVYQNREGVAATFALEARKPLAEIASGLQFAAANYQNGDRVQAVNLNALVPEGVKISWANNNANIGLAASGAGFIPEFIAVNTGTANASATITYTLAYSDGKGCSATANATQTITVKPKTNADTDLVAGVAVTNPVACSNGSFAAITFSAKDRGTAVTGVTYRVELVSGDPIVSIPAASNTATWSPAAVMTGKAIYRVVPVYQNREGVAATFALEVRKSLAEIAAGLNFAAVTYRNGDRVQAVNLNALVPEGVKVTWTNSKPEIGIASGAGIVPEFTATNTGTADIAAVITYTLAYEDGKGCTTSANVTQNITVKPKTNLDQDLVAGVTAGNPVTCAGVKFAAVTFSAKDKGTNVTTGVTYRVEFAGGDPIISGLPVTLTTAAWEPTPIMAGKAVFRVVPVYQNREGVAATFSLEARKPLTEIAAGLQFAAVTYQNGDHVQAVNLNALVPEGVKISWANNNANIGLAASGAGFIPEFTAVNTGSTDASATITYTLAYSDGKGCTASANATQTVKVKPKTSLDQDLVAGVSVAAPVICSDGAFAAITFSANDRGTKVTGGVTYRVELVGGDPVVSGIPATLTAATWNPGTPAMTGKAIYRVVPVYQNREGIAATFALEVRKSLASIASTLNFAPAVYQNGDQVQAVNLNALVPEGVKISWANSNTAIGLAAQGAGMIPAFTAANTGAADINATITYTISYMDGLTCSTVPPVTQAITVKPRTNVDLDLVTNAVPGQITCSDAAFNAITFGAKDRGTAVAGAQFRIEFVSGDNIFNIPQGLVASWTPASSQAGKAIYRAVPVYQNREGVAAMFSLQVRQSLAYHVSWEQTDTLTYRNGDVVGAINMNSVLPEGAKVKWLIEKEIGLSLTGGNGIIPQFTALNTTAEAITAKITFIFSYGGNQAEIGDCPVTMERYIKVLPTASLGAGNDKGTVTELAYCANDHVILEVKATGYRLQYQWFKNGEAIEGATRAIFEIESVKASDAGDYYAVVSDRYESMESKTFRVSIKPDIIEQRWNDVLVLNTFPHENGGYTFTAFQWYEISNGTVLKLAGQNHSYLYAENDLDINASYYVEAVTDQGTIFKSCPFSPRKIETQDMTVSVYPNPVYAGEVVNVGIAGVNYDLERPSIQLLDVVGGIISVTKVTEPTTQIRMPNKRGIYLVRVLIGDNSKSFKIIVE